MEITELIQSESESFQVSELRRLLGIGKTDSYWLIKRHEFRTVTVKGKMRILKSAFWEWYDHQTKYSIRGGPMPGQALREMSYSVSELAEFLAVSDNRIYTLIAKNIFDTFVVDYCTRITKESFERWYAGQSKFRIPEDRIQDEEKLALSYSFPDIRHMLNVHRNTVYGIICNEKNKGVFEFITVADQKRVTIESFERWYKSQKRYHIHTVTADLPSIEVAEKAETPPEKHPCNVQDKPLYSIDDLKLALGVSYKVANGLIQSGKVLAVKVGRTYLIPSAEFDRITGRRPDNGHDHTEE